MKKFILSVVLLFSISSFAQRGVLKGTILDETKQPLPGATIIISENQSGTATNYNGKYELLNLKNGTYTISVSFIGYATASQKVTINNNVVVKDFQLAPKTNNLEEVVIIGSIAKGQAKALNKQKTNENITNVISSDQVGKFPDANIGDALKRVPGIAMQNDQGEARDIVVRGLAPQLNSVTFNGDKLPSAEGDNRRVQMDLIPADMIQTIEVSKTVTPDMEADAIGGSVNLVTRTASKSFRSSITTAFGMSPIRDGNIYNVGGLVSGRVLDNKLGVVLNASYNSNNYGSDNVEFEWNEDKIKEHDIRKYDVKRVRKSVGLNLDLKASEKHSFEFKSIFNQRDDNENRYRLRYKFKKGKYTISRQTKGGIDNDDNMNRRLERQTTYKFGLGGDHIVFNNVKLDWKVSTSKAKEFRPNERYITYKTKQKEDLIEQKDLNTKTPYFVGLNSVDTNLENFELDEIAETKRYTEEMKLGSRINVKIPLITEGKYQNKLKFGYKFKYKEKLRDNNFFDYTGAFEDKYGKMTSVATSNQTLKDFLPGSQYKSGFFATNKFLGSLNFNSAKGKSVLSEFAPENYEASEKIGAYYVMLNQKLGKKLSFITGIRVETTDTDYMGYVFDEESDAETIDELDKKYGNKNYVNYLPNFQLKYKPSKSTVLRLAWTNTISRPNYYDMVPYVSVNSDDLEGKIGNPELIAAKSMNFDLMGEYYFKNVGIISIGGFYKNIDDFIYTKTSKENLTVGGETETYDIERPNNGGNAMIYGIEIAIQRKLNFLPGFLKNLNIYGNYTYTGSETKGIGGREDGLALSGAIDQMINASLAYETKSFTLRGSLNYASDYIDEYGDKPINDRYYDKQMFVDVNLSYEFLKGLRFFAEAKNLTNQPLRYYQGTVNKTMQLEYYNLNWNAGLKFNF